MRRTMISIFAVILLGLCGGAVRALQLYLAFDAATYLPLRGHWLHWLMLGLTAAAAVWAFICARAYIPAPYAVEPGEKLRKGMLLLGVVSALLLLASALLDLLSLLEGVSVTQLVLALLSMMAMTGILITGRGLFRKMTMDNGAFWAIVPVFWSCFWLILMFRQVSGNPVLMRYAFDLFAAVCVSLALYLSAGSFLEQERRRLTIFFALTGVFLCLMCLVAPLIGLLCFRTEFEPLDFAQLTRYAFGAVYMSVLVWQARHQKDYGVPDEEDEEETDAEEEDSSETLDTP